MTTRSIGVTTFKSTCLAVIDAVASGRIDGVVLTRRDKAVARIVPIEPRSGELWGALKGTARVTPGTDLTASTGEAWEGYAE